MLTTTIFPSGRPATAMGTLGLCFLCLGGEAGYTLNCEDGCMSDAVDPHLQSYEVGPEWGPSGVGVVPWYSLPPQAPASGIGPFQCPIHLCGRVLCVDEHLSLPAFRASQAGTRYCASAFGR